MKGKRKRIFVCEHCSALYYVDEDSSLIPSGLCDECGEGTIKPLKVFIEVKTE